MEAMSGGYAVEYICRVVNQTDGQESIPESATMAQNTLQGKTAMISGKKAANDASDSKTDVYWNSALKVAMPALNGLTDGMAGQVIGKGRQIMSVGKTIATGAGVGAVLGAAAPLIAQLVSEAVNNVMRKRAQNDALAESIDATNLRRQMAGLGQITYSRSGITKIVRLEEYR